MNGGSAVIIDDQDLRSWNIAEDRDLQDTIDLLLVDPDPSVRARARNTERMLDSLHDQRRTRLSEILGEETDELVRAGRLAVSGDEGDDIPGGIDPARLRRKLIDDALDAERAGSFGLAAELAKTAISLEWIVDDRTMIATSFPEFFEFMTDLGAQID